MPEIGATNDGGYVWDGARWQRPGQSAPAAGRGNSPIPARPENNTELLKQMLTTTGLVAGGALAPEIEGPALLARYFPTLLRIGSAAVGGAMGRMAGHVPEAAITATTGQPSGNTFAGDAATGAVEGAIGEAAPLVASPVLRTGGRLLRAAGRAVGDFNLIPGVPAWMQRAGLSHLFGGGVTGDVAATVAPKVAEGVGAGAQWVGEQTGGNRTTSELVQDALGALRRRLFPEPVASHAERMAAGAEKFAGAKRATAAQQAAREAASGVPPDLGERVTVSTRATVPQPDVAELPSVRALSASDVPPWLREEGGPVGQGLRPAGPPPPPPPPEPTILDSLRQRSGTSIAPGEAPPPPTRTPPLTVPEPPPAPPAATPRTTGTSFSMAAPPLEVPEPMASHTVVRPATSVETLEARTVPAAKTAAKATAKAPPPQAVGSWVDAAKEQIGQAEAAGIGPEDATLQQLRQAVADAEATIAPKKTGQPRGSAGRFGGTKTWKPYTPKEE